MLGGRIVSECARLVAVGEPGCYQAKLLGVPPLSSGNCGGAQALVRSDHHDRPSAPQMTSTISPTARKAERILWPAAVGLCLHNEHASTQAAGSVLALARARQAYRTAFYRPWRPTRGNGLYPFKSIHRSSRRVAPHNAKHPKHRSCCGTRYLWRSFHITRLATKRSIHFPIAAVARPPISSAADSAPKLHSDVQLKSRAMSGARMLKL